jgi:ERF superfamily
VSTPEKTITLAQSDRLNALATRVDVQALIAIAVEHGASIETLERLVGLARDIRAVSAREAYYEAIAAFQQRCPPIHKKGKATIVTRSGGSYSYKYAPLDEILSTIQPIMGELGLSVSWRMRMEPNAVVANCRISHRLGHYEESGDLVMPFQNDGRMNPAQVVGSASTYAKRYSLLAILGMSPEDDDDAGGTDGRDGKDARKTTSETVAGRAVGEPAPVPHLAPSAPGESGQPEDYREESETLFPTPEEQERQALIVRIQKAGTKLSKQQRGKLKEVFLGDAEADILKADVAALQALATHIEQSAAK